jgi:hypothetical protein
MSNTVICTIKVTGDRRFEIKDLFQKSSVPTGFGNAWDVYGSVLLCDANNGDGITVEDDAIVIRSESRNSPPLPLVEKLSEDYPELTFDVIGKDPLNCFIQRWIFRSGQGQLLDCVQGAYEEEGEEIVYMLNGKQFIKLPQWVAAEDHPDFDKASIECIESELSKWKSAKFDGITMIDRIDELVLAALRSGRDEYSNLKLSALTLMKPIESAQIAEILPEPSDQAAAIRWVMRGLSVEHAVAKVRLDHKMVEAIRDKRRSEKELQQSLDMSSEEIEEMKMYLKGK